MSEVTSTEVVKVLRAAKRRIETWGWAQDAFMDSKGRMCALTGMKPDGKYTTKACLRSDAAIEAFKTVVNAPCVMIWNDAPDRTLEDVYQAFDAAIELARGPRR